MNVLENTQIEPNGIHRPPPRKGRTRALALALLMLGVLVGLGAVAFPRLAGLPALLALVRIAPNDAGLFYQIGLKARQEGKLGLACQAFARAATLEPDSEQDNLAWAAAAGTVSGQREAFNILATFLRSHPASGRAHLMMSLLYSQKKEESVALREAGLATQDSPRDPEAWRIRAIDALTWDDRPQAEMAARRAAALGPRDWHNWLVLGQAFSVNDQSAEAVRCLRDAVRLAPDEGIVQSALGEQLFQTASTPADVEEARQHLETSVRLRADIPLCHLFLGQIAEREKRLPQARQEFALAARMAPNDAQAAYWQARCDTRLGDAADAKREYARFQWLAAYQTQKLHLTEGPAHNQLPTRLKLARLYAEHGDYTPALDQYTEILRHYPTLTAVRQEMARLRQAHPDESQGLVSLPMPS